MAPRPELKPYLEAVHPTVYIEPPPDVQMTYPCIVTDDISDIKVEHADNQPHFVEKRYLVKVISTDVEEPIVDQMIRLPKCSFGRHYVADNLHHFTFNLYL